MAATVAPTEKYVFYVDWMDPHAQLVRKYTLTYFPEDSSFEMFDLKSKRNFLKRSKQPGITLNDLHIGSSVTVLSRQLFITGYANDVTQLKLGENIQKSVVICPASLYSKFGQIVDTLIQEGFHLMNARIFQTQENEGYHRIHAQSTSSSSGDQFQRALVLQVSRQDAFYTLSKILDEKQPKNICKRLNFTPGSIVTSKDELDAQQDSEKLFGSQVKFPRTAKFENTTCAIIRPHAVSQGLSGQIIDSILSNGFTITDLQMVQLQRVDSEEFLEVYKNVVPEYHMMVDQLSSGPLIALEIENGKSSIVKDFKDFSGPPDPELAKVIRPKSLRALYGEDTVKNGVHCTDVPDDAILEVEF